MVEYSAAINVASADNASAYELAPIIKVKASGKGKNRKPATTRPGAPVPVASAVYSNDQAILRPLGKLAPKKHQSGQFPSFPRISRSSSTCLQVSWNLRLNKSKIQRGRR